MRTTAGFVALLFLVLSSVAYGSVPGRLDYQGYLTDAVGTPIDCQGCATPYTIQFSIYDQQVEGAVLWSEVHASVPIMQGVFHVELGVQETIDPAILEGNSWLEITVNAQGPMVPRQRIVSVPYAMRAHIAEHAIESENAVSLGGHSADSYVTVTDSDVFLTESELNTVLESLGYVAGDNDTLGDLTSCAVDEILKWDGSAWVCAVNADTDTLSSLLCASSEIAQWNGTTWSCSAALDSLQANIDTVQANVDTVQTNVDTVQANVDTVQANVDTVQANVDALDASLDPIAKDGLPAALADGDDVLTEAEVLAMVAGAGYITGDHFSGSWGDLTDVPASLADGDDTLTNTDVLNIVSGAGYLGAGTGMEGFIIKAGRTAQNGNGGGQMDIAVDFGITFGGVPFVVASPTFNGVNYDELPKLQILGIGTTGTTVRLRRTNGNYHPATPYHVDWIAIGPAP
ncbi:MAG: hypothetical protein CMH54_05050 [Myxococcales bacterium]|nr:hypothetical protein [Myxococcales bacterium]